MDDKIGTPQIAGLPPGAIVKPIAKEPAPKKEKQQVSGLPPGAVVKPITPPAQPDVDAGDDGVIPLSELSAQNPNNEGLYKMKDDQGHLYGVPFSNVQMADNFRTHFVDEAEAKRFEKDVDSQQPTWKDKILAHTGPISDEKRKQIREQGALLPEWLKDRPKKEQDDFLKASKDDAEFQIQKLDFERGFANGAGTLVLHPWETVKSLWQQMGDAAAYVAVKTQKFDGDESHIREEDKKQAEEFQQMLRDMKTQYKTNSPYMLGQFAGQALATKGLEVVGGKTLKVGGKIVKAVPDLPMNTLRKIYNTGPKATERYVAETANANDKLLLEAKTEGEKAHAAKVKEVREANDAAKKEHEAAVKARNEAESKRIDLIRKAAEARTRLHNHIRDIHSAAVDWFNKQYDKLGELTKDVKVDLTPLAEAVKDGKLADIAGSDTKIPIFEDVIRRAKGEAGAGGEKPEYWNDLSEDEKKQWATQNAQDRGISYKDLTGYWRELGKIIKSPSTMDDIRTAAIKVRGVIEGMQQEAARKAGPKASQLNYSIAQKYKNFAESYRDAGAAGTKAIGETNSVDATKPFLAAKTAEEVSDLKKQVVGREPTTEGKKTNATEWAGRNSAEDTAGKRLTTKQRRAQTEKLIDQTRKVHEDLKEAGGDKPHPEVKPLVLEPEPEYTPPKEKTISPEQMRLEKVDNMNKRIATIQSNGMKIGVKSIGTIGLADILLHIGGFSGGMEAIAGGLAVATFFAPEILDKILNMPGVKDKLVAITKADTEALAKLPANQRFPVEQGIVNMTQMAKSEGILKPTDPTPLANFAKKDLPKTKVEAEKVVVPADEKRGVEKVKLPVQKTVPKAGDYVQWESKGTLRMPKAAKLTHFSPDGKFAFVEGSTTGIPVDELISSEPPDDDPGGGAAPVSPSPEPEKPGGVGAAKSLALPETVADIAKQDKRLSPWNLMFPEAQSMADIFGWLREDLPSTTAKQRARLNEIAEQRYARVRNQLESLPNEVTVYRAVSAPNAEGVDIAKPGEYWTTDPEQAQAHWGERGGHQKFILKGTVPKSAIDVLRTIKARMRGATGFIEKELTLPHGTELKDVEIQNNPSAKPTPKGDGSALPGMEGAVAEQRGAAEDFKTEAQKKEAESSLVTPKADISKAAGEMERNSPLFRDSEASGQSGLFSQPQEVSARNTAAPSRRLEDLKVDPKRFQYKLGGNKAGVTDALSDAKWDQDLADPIHIWEDPEDGNEYVVNGHHRYELAQRAGADRINVQSIDNTKIKTAAEAREFGAMKNIADGNGTSVDAAKFFREKELTPEDLSKRGLGLKKSVANEGVALSRLSDDIFNRVVDGKLDPKIGAAIGDATDSATDQAEILKDVKRRESQGRPVNADQIRESARLIKQAPSYSETTQDLFGNHEETRSLFLEMGEVSEYIQKELADEKRIFNRVSTKGAAEQLAKGKNVINAGESAKVAQRAAQLQELYLKRSAQAGPIHAALQEAAERLAEGGKPNEIKQSVLEEIREHLDEELGEQVD